MGTAQTVFEVVLPEMTSPEVASPEVNACACVTGYDDTGNEREIISCTFYPYFPRFLPVIPLDSRYEQWNCRKLLNIKLKRHVTPMGSLGRGGMRTSVTGSRRFSLLESLLTGNDV
jgi:hypothetical protein